MNIEDLSQLIRKRRFDKVRTIIDFTKNVYSDAAEELATIIKPDDQDNIDLLFDLISMSDNLSLVAYNLLKNGNTDLVNDVYALFLQDDIMDFSRLIGKYDKVDYYNSIYNYYYNYHRDFHDKTALNNIELINDYVIDGAIDSENVDIIFNVIKRMPKWWHIESVIETIISEYIERRAIDAMKDMINKQIDLPYFLPQRNRIVIRTIIQRAIVGDDFEIIGDIISDISTKDFTLSLFEVLLVVNDAPLDKILEMYNDKIDVDLMLKEAILLPDVKMIKYILKIGANPRVGLDLLSDPALYDRQESNHRYHPDDLPNINNEIQNILESYQVGTMTKPSRRRNR